MCTVFSPTSSKAILISIKFIKARTNAFLQILHEQYDPDLHQMMGTQEGCAHTRDFKHKLKSLTSQGQLTF